MGPSKLPGCKSALIENPYPTITRLAGCRFDYHTALVLQAARINQYLRSELLGYMQLDPKTAKASFTKSGFVTGAALLTLTLLAPASSISYALLAANAHPPMHSFFAGK
jgi:hypothetical protein